ncbi:hypothetical protein AKJ16_DCAP16265 [Drosera capensis]
MERTTMEGNMGRADERCKWEAGDLVLLDTGGIGFTLLVDMERFVCHAGADSCCHLVVHKIILLTESAHKVIAMRLPNGGGE